MSFCILCGKHRHEPLTNIPLGQIEEGVVVSVECCSGCEVILHNIRRCFEDTRKRWLEDRKKKAQAILSQKP